MLSDKAVAVGQIPSGLFIVAVQDPASNTIDGYLASWIQQVSFEPLMLSMAIKPGRPAYDLIKSGKPFAVNVVGDHDKTFLKHFWKGYDAADNPFSTIPYEIGENGGVLLKQAKSAMECRLVSAAQPGDHEVFFVSVLSSYQFSEEGKPMTHIRKSGASY